jgi:hypothetical protein
MLEAKTSVFQMAFDGEMEELTLWANGWGKPKESSLRKKPSPCADKEA